MTILFFTFTERKDMSLRSLLSGFVFLHFFSLVAQVSYPGRPVGVAYGLPVEFVSIERNQRENVQDAEMNKYKTFQFADEVRVDINPESAGLWYQVTTSMRVWIMGLCSPGVSSMGIIFSRYRIKPGVKIFVYPYRSIRYGGAFTFRNNNKNGILPISSFATDSLIIEMQVPYYVEDYGELKIGSVGLGYPSQRRIAMTLSDSSISAWCNVDVTCYLNRELQLQKHSVCKIVYNNSGVCTGTLLNNTAWDGRPLVLTSAHCIKSDTAAQSALFYFDYEREVCDGKLKPLKSVAGSRLLARNVEYDFALLEINEKIPYDFNPVYAGWNITGDNFSKSYTIHHPMGDVKKVSVNEDLVMDGRLFNIPNDNYWVIPNYEVGTTQAGSSGSALFDSVFHIKGILSYGGESCKPFIYDYYIRLDKAWEPSSDTMQQLAYWLNPKKLDDKILPYFQPNPFLPYANHLTNVDTLDQLKHDSYYGSGYVAGTNPLRIAAFAEHFRINGAKYIYAVKVHVHRLFASSNRSTLKLKIWSGKDRPVNVLYQQQILLFELAPDEYNLIRLDTMKLVNGSFFVGFELNTQPDDTFSMYYVEQPTMQKNTAWAFYNRGWFPLYSGESYISASLDIELLTFDYYIPPESNPGEFPYPTQVSIYPNPASNYVQVLFKNVPKQMVKCYIYDLQGRICRLVSRSDNASNFTIDVSNLKTGFYIFSVHAEWGVFNFKVLIRR